MIPKLRAGLLATAMAAVSLVPASSLMTVASVDMAFAKGGNGNGNGGGNGNGHGNGRQESEARGGQKAAHGGGRPEWAGSRGNGGGRSESARGGRDPVSNFIRGLTGQDKRDAREAARAEARAARRAPTEYAPVASISPGKRPPRNSEMHPSELGNMNGALNANINAVLAHIRNGNTNGPVGQMAALAVASARANEAFDALAPEDVAAYGNLQDAIEKTEFDSLAEYFAAREAGEVEEIEGIEAALAEIPEFDETTYADYLAAREEADAILSPAQESILAYWNKNPDAQPEIDHELEEPLLDALMSRFDGYEPEIDAAIAEAEVRATSGVEEDEKEASCEFDESCDAPETDTVAAAD